MMFQFLTEQKVRFYTRLDVDNIGDAEKAK